MQKRRTFRRFQIGGDLVNKTDIQNRRVETDLVMRKFANILVARRAAERAALEVLV